MSNLFFRLYILCFCFLYISHLAFCEEFKFPGFYSSGSERVCASKTEGCNSCSLTFNYGNFGWSCTELGCPPEPKKTLKGKCTEYVNTNLFKRISSPFLTEQDQGSCTAFFNAILFCQALFDAKRGIHWDCRQNRRLLNIDKTVCFADYRGNVFQDKKSLYKTLQKQAKERESQNARLQKEVKLEESIYQSCYKGGQFCQINLFPKIGKDGEIVYERHETCEEKESAKNKKDLCWNRVLESQISPIVDKKPKWFKQRINEVEDCIHYENKCLDIKLEFSYKKKWEWLIHEKDNAINCTVRPKTRFWQYPMLCKHKLEY